MSAGHEHEHHGDHEHHDAHRSGRAHDDGAHAGHDHGHAGHDHGHAGHGHAPASFGTAFLVGTILNGAFVATEAIYGVRSNSVALLADAGHNLSDVLGLLLAWGASTLAGARPTRRYTYGLRSTSILAALANAVLLLVVTGGIAWEAIVRLRQPEHAEANVVTIVAAIGVAINLATALMFMSGRKGDLNVRAAFAHMAGDAAIALGVVVAGLAMKATGWLWLDPVVSLAISVLVIAGTWGLLKDSVNLALQAVPEGVDLEAVRRYLTAQPGVQSIHDLHIWGLSTTQVALTAHLVVPGEASSDAMLGRMASDLEERFNIAHATIQIERGDAGEQCRLAPDEVV